MFHLHRHRSLYLISTVSGLRTLCMFDKALQLSRQALAAWISSVCESHPQRLRAMLDIASILCDDRLHAISDDSTTTLYLAEAWKLAEDVCKISARDSPTQFNPVHCNALLVMSDIYCKKLELEVFSSLLSLFQILYHATIAHFLLSSWLWISCVKSMSCNNNILARLILTRSTLVAVWRSLWSMSIALLNLFPSFMKFCHNVSSYCSSHACRTVTRTSRSNVLSVTY